MYADPDAETTKRKADDRSAIDCKMGKSIEQGRRWRISLVF
jgi:hypothetical protein